MWATVLLSVVAASAVIMLMSPGRPWWQVLLRVAVISLGGVAVIYVRRRREKRATGGSDRTVVGLDEKLRRGEVPEDAGERDAMARLVAHRLHASRHWRWAAVGMFLLVGLVAVAVAATADAPVAIGYTVFSLAFLAWPTWSAVRHRRRLRHMAEAVGRSGPAGASRAGGTMNTRGGTA
ncbi:hypothetical protein [Streptomyces sp. CB03238]|uniref:hypothetical protein n=1 Tax=Streptomyces sp. CB03238 TaxID=1907777 RepID=UPI000A1174AD|nr:hypothetical protein [Streptomyces sp. CB03238]ORT53727.1 hypothetical protein BKD26_37650 [Streptomyces sp. CB03238]